MNWMGNSKNRLLKRKSITTNNQKSFFAKQARQSVDPHATLAHNKSNASHESLYLPPKRQKFGLISQRSDHMQPSKPCSEMRMPSQQQENRPDHPNVASFSNSSLMGHPRALQTQQAPNRHGNENYYTDFGFHHDTGSVRSCFDKVQKTCLSTRKKQQLQDNDMSPMSNGYGAAPTKVESRKDFRKECDLIELLEENIAELKHIIGMQSVKIEELETRIIQYEQETPCAGTFIKGSETGGSRSPIVTFHDHEAPPSPKTNEESTVYNPLAPQFRPNKAQSPLMEAPSTGSEYCRKLMLPCPSKDDEPIYKDECVCGDRKYDPRHITINICTGPVLSTNPGDDQKLRDATCDREYRDHPSENDRMASSQTNTMEYRRAISLPGRSHVLPLPASEYIYNQDVMLPYSVYPTTSRIEAIED